MRFLRSVILAIGLMGLGAACGGSDKPADTTPAANTMDDTATDDGMDATTDDGMDEGMDEGMDDGMGEDPCAEDPCAEAEDPCAAADDPCGDW